MFNIIRNCNREPTLPGMVTSQSGDLSRSAGGVSTPRTNLNDAVTAINSVTILEDGSIKRSMCLIEGVWYGKEILDVKTGKGGWIVRVVPIWSSLLRSKLIAGRSPKYCHVRLSTAANLDDVEMTANDPDETLVLTFTRTVEVEVINRHCGDVAATFKKVERSQVLLLLT